VYEQTPQLISLKKTDSGYIIPKIPVLLTGLRKLSFGIQAYDRMSGSNNADGIYSAKLLVDDRLASEFVIDSISYDETSYMNAHIDYRLRFNGGVFLQHLARLPGDFGGVYREIEGDGVVNLEDTTIHRISIDVRDAKNNISVLNFFIQFNDSLAQLADALPSNRESFAPVQVNTLEKTDFEAYLQEGCLYDTLHPVYSRRNSSGAYAVSATHQLNDGSFPLHADISVRIKPDRPIPEEWKDRLLIQKSGHGTSTRVAEWQGAWLSAKFGDLGTFQAYADIIAPTINPPGKGDTINLSAATRIVFTPADNFGIKSFRAELNGQWLRFTNDKSRNWIYVFDERVPYGVHELKVTVSDLVGNTTTKTWWFKKYPYKPPVKKKYTRKKTTVKKKPVTRKNKK
jgi:hypothetical protein